MIAEILTLAAGSWAVVTVWDRWDRRRAWRRHTEQALSLCSPRGPEDDPDSMRRIADHAADLLSDREAEWHGPPATFRCLVCGRMVADTRAHSRYFHGGR